MRKEHVNKYPGAFVCRMKVMEDRGVTADEVTFQVLTAVMMKI